MLGHAGVIVIVCWEWPRGRVTCSSSEGEAVRSLTAMASRSPAQVSERRPLQPQEDFPNLWEKELKALFGLTGAKTGNMSSRGKVGTVGEALPGCFIPCGPQRGALEVLGALRSPLGHPDAGEPSCRPGEFTWTFQSLGSLEECGRLGMSETCIRHARSCSQSKTENLFVGRS